MKIFYNFSILFVLFTACSFDNKTGIWKDATKEELSVLLSKSQKTLFNKEIQNKDKIIKLEDEKKLVSWQFSNYTISNKIPNVTFSDSKIITKLSSRLSRSVKKDEIFYYKDNLISFDHKGTIFVFSTTSNQKIFEYNFYKKNFKNREKKLSIAIQKDTIFVSDNFGYLYSLDIKKKKIKWAKNFGIPFRSNIKIIDDILILANQENILYGINVNNGDKIWQLATNFKLLKSKFINSIAIGDGDVYFLNTSGELYSINLINNNINWVQNFSNKFSSGGSEIFISNSIIVSENNIIVTTNEALYQVDSKSGNRNLSMNLVTEIQPLVTEENIIIFTKNKFLICIDRLSGEIIWSKNFIKQLIDIKKKFKIGKIDSIYAANNNLIIISRNGYLLKLSFNSGEILEIVKFLKKDLGSNPIFVNNKIFSLDAKKNLFEYR